MKIICDIDGTIAKVGDRIKYLQQTPKDWDAFYNGCHEDEPYDDIIKLVSDMSKQGHQIIFLTGRRESVRSITHNWIEENYGLNSPYDGYFDYLLMRKNGDLRHDTDVKPELLEELLESIECDKGDIWLILEDRNSMVNKWRELGFRCLQVQEGDF